MAGSARLGVTVGGFDAAIARLSALAARGVSAAFGFLDYVEDREDGPYVPVSLFEPLGR